MSIANPPHPRVIVREEFLEPPGLAVTKAAKKLGVSRIKLSCVVRSRSGMHRR